MDDKKYDVIIGIPCKGLEDLKSEIPCTNEAEATAIAAGVSLAGKIPKLFMQSSGFLTTLDIHTSLLFPYEIHVGEMVIYNTDNPEHHLYCSTAMPHICGVLRGAYDAVRKHLGDNGMCNKSSCDNLNGNDFSRGVSSP